MSLRVLFHELGGPEVLRLEEHRLGAPGHGELALDVEAIGLNRAEAAFRRGAYLDRPALPSGLGYEAAGTVAAVGPGVSGFAVGQPVSVVPAFSMNDYGTYGDRVLVPAAAVVPRPASVDPVTAAAAWMAYLTPFGALVELGGMRAGDTVVVTAAASGVGVATVQLAALLGAEPIAVVRSDAGADRLREAGAVRVTTAAGEELTREILEHTDGAGARFVFDAVAGPGVRDLARATALGGTLFVHGTLSGQPTPFPGTDEMRDFTMRSYTLFEITRSPERLRRAARFVGSALAAGRLRPLVDRTFELTEIVQAHAYLETTARVGKIVVTVERRQE